MIEYTCPTCGQHITVQTRDDLPTRPFCCERCKMVDLYKWFQGEYRISEPLMPDIDDDPDAGL